MEKASHFLSSFFKVFTKKAGNRESKISRSSGKLAKHPADLPEEIQRQISLAEIKAATNKFDENLIIGQGGFGNVYKGIINGGNLVIAIKRSIPKYNSEKEREEYQREVQLLCQLRHQHIISLLGFCNEDDEMILVYEYMANGSLRDHLHENDYDPLPWKRRLQICISAARGLHYLHTGAKQTIIHRDINSSNILLDENWVSKLSDFGMSKLCSRSQSKGLKKIESRVTGTVGYLDPQYMKSYEVSEKSDVFSFGVVLFEILCARKPIELRFPVAERILVRWARSCLLEGTIYNIIDPYLMGRIAPECFKVFVDIAFCCTNWEGNTRPDMGEVELMLELALELQEKADSDMTHHVEYVYEPVVSFAASVPEHHR